VDLNSQRASRLALGALLLTLYSTLGVVRLVTNALRDANLLRVFVGLVFAAAACAVGVFVARSPSLRRPGTLAALGLTALVYALVLSPMESPEEKLHFVEYGVVALLAFAAAPARWSDPRRLVTAALFTAAVGALDEGFQALLPSRYADQIGRASCRERVS
jgi:phosphatidylserine synthase